MTIRRAGGLVEEELTHSAIGGFFTVHRELGPGFLEHIYVLGLEKELTARGHKVSREVWVPVYFRGELLSYQRIDLLVDDKLVIEVKATERLHPRAKDQLISYLRATNLEVGLLLHFGYEAKFERAVFLNSTKLRSSPDGPERPRDPRKRRGSLPTSD
jgi:GxxExxY protein